MLGKWMVVLSACAYASQCTPRCLHSLEDDNLIVMPTQQQDVYFDENTFSEEDRAVMRYFDGLLKHLSLILSPPSAALHVTIHVELCLFDGFGLGVAHRHGIRRIFTLLFHMSALNQWHHKLQ
jgi:hypothetical protein